MNEDKAKQAVDTILSGGIRTPFSANMSEAELNEAVLLAALGLVKYIRSSGIPPEKLYDIDVFISPHEYASYDIRLSFGKVYVRASEDAETGALVCELSVYPLKIYCTLTIEYLALVVPSLFTTIEAAAELCLSTDNLKHEMKKYTKHIEELTRLHAQNILSDAAFVESIDNLTAMKVKKKQEIEQLADDYSTLKNTLREALGECSFEIVR